MLMNVRYTLTVLVILTWTIPIVAVVPLFFVFGKNSLYSPLLGKHQCLN